MALSSGQRIKLKFLAFPLQEEVEKTQISALCRSKGAAFHPGLGERGMKFPPEVE